MKEVKLSLFADDIILYIDNPKTPHTQKPFRTNKINSTRLWNIKSTYKNQLHWGFPGVTVVKNLPTSVGDTGSSPGPGRSHMPLSS